MRYYCEYGYCMENHKDMPEQLIGELADMRRRIAELEQSETEHRDVEESLRSSEDKYMRLIEMTDTGYVILDDQGRVTDVNQEYVRLAGRERMEDVIGHSVLEWTAPHDYERNASAVKECFSQGFVRNLELDYLSPSGKITPVEINATVLLDPEGPPRILTLCRDITERRRIEEKTLAAHRLLSSVLDAVPDLLNVIDRDYRIQYTNDKHGVLDEKLVPEMQSICYRRFKLLDAPCEGCIAQPVFETGCVGEQEVYNPADGTVREVRAFPVFDSSGRVELVVKHVRDITERKKTEQALQESGAMLRKEQEFNQLLLDTSPVFVVAIGFDGKTLAMNRALLNALEYDKEAITGVDYVNTFVPEEDRKMLAGVFQRIIEREEATVNENRIISRSGKVYLVEWHGRTASHGEGGFGFFVGVGIDITERKRAEEELRRMNLFLDSIVENIPDMVFLKDAEELRFVLFNRAGEDLLGNSREDLIGKNDYDFFPKEQADFFTQNDREALSGKEILDIPEEPIQTRHKGERILHTKKVPILNAKGEPEYLLGISEDITERKKWETKLVYAQKMEAIGTLSGGIAHDFNNILMGIQGYASLMMLDISTDHPHYRQLKRIEEQVHSAADLTRQLLGFAGGGKYVVEPVNMNELINRTSIMFGRTKKELVIHRKYENNLWVVEADRGQIEQVLLNLLLNAWQAMPAGGDLSLETRNMVVDENYAALYSMMPGRYVQVSVNDTGAGMDKKTKERIFEPFFTTKELGKGTGLGLAMVYGIIKNHNGFIDVMSEPGKGTTFTLYLPASEKDVAEGQPAVLKTMRGTENILLVDDEPNVLAVGKAILESLGYSVYAAKNGKEALALYKEKMSEIDLIVLDMIMPGFSGSKLFDCIRELNPSARVILSSGYSLNGQARQIMNRGCDGFIAKPFSITDISRKIREVLENKEVKQ